MLFFFVLVSTHTLSTKHVGSNKSFSFHLVCGVIIQGQESCRFIAVSNSNVSCGNASSNVSNSAICTASSASNAVNVNKLDNVASNAKTSADDGPKRCSLADLNSNGSPVLGEPGPDASVEVSPSSSVDADMVPASNHRKRSSPKPPLEDSAAPPGFTSGSSLSEPGKSRISRKAPVHR